MPSASLPALGPELPRTGGPTTRALGRWVLASLGWRIDGDIPNVRKLVIIAAPHTSNWDFVVGIAAKLALGLDVRFLAKDTLFRFPLGVLMRYFGGIPVDRSASHDVVRAMVDELARHERLLVALAPQGTRKHGARWRTGFYYIAHGAGVAILPVALNFGERAIQIRPPFMPTGDADADLRELQARFAGVRGRHAGG